MTEGEPWVALAMAADFERAEPDPGGFLGDQRDAFPLVKPDFR